jgi:hypothetical protein
MTRPTFWLGLTAILGAAALALPAPADPPKGDPAAQDAQAQEVELLAEAYRLAETGEKLKLPEAYVAAGSAILKLKALTHGKMGTLDAKPEILDEHDKPVPGAKADTLPTENLDDIAQNFFDSASKLGSDLHILKEVDAEVRSAKARTYATGTRGALGGPKWFVRGLGAHQTHVFNIPFDTYTVASIGFQSNLPVRLKMHIGGYVHFEQVLRVGQYTWKPRPDAPVKTYTIVVHNPNNFALTYKLFTN